MAAPGSPRRLEVEDPASGRVVGRVDVAGPAEVAALAAAGRAAQPAWDALGAEARGRLLRRAARWLLDHGDEVVASIVSETGKADEEARLVELTYAARALRFWAPVRCSRGAGSAPPTPRSGSSA